jgi:serine/threonine-protein kinase
VLAPLGSGAQGRTFLAEGPGAERVVLKAVRGGAPEALRREADALRSLRHPHVVAMHDVAEEDGEVILVMEYLEGGNLRDRLARGALGPEEFRRVATGLLAGLAAVHNAGQVHRDVKPSNVLLSTDGEAKLADFGVARAAGAETTLGRPEGTAVGTLRYMSPEQAKGKRVTTRSDLFSAAATLYEAYTGQPYIEPVEGESAVELQLRAATQGPFRKRAQPAAMRAWFAQALDPQPARRFASADAMREALLRALGSAGEGATPARS